MEWVSYPVTEQVHIENFFSLFQIHYENEFHFPGESHNFWECLYVLKGSVCVSGDERIYRLTEGDLIFHKPLELHKFYIDNKGGADLLIFSFSLEGTLTGYLQNKVFALDTEQREILRALLHYIQTQAKKINISEDVSPYMKYLEMFQHSKVYAQMITTYIYQLLLSLSDNGNIASAVTAPDTLLFRQAVNYMTAHINHNPSVSVIAQHCGTSESGLKRLFLKYAGMSVHKYFLKLKFKTAAELLHSGLNVNETAEKLGFSTQSYFSVACKREMGMNPSQLKESGSSVFHTNDF